MGPAAVSTAGDASVDGGESGDRGAESQVDPRGPHCFRDIAGHVGVQHRAHGCVQPFDHRHVEAASEQPLRDLQSDVAGADHHGAPGPRVESLFHLRRVVEGAELQHPFRVDARPRRGDARRAGADEEFVIVLDRLPTGVEVAHRHGRRHGSRLR